MEAAMSHATTAPRDFDLQHYRIRGARVAARRGAVEIHSLGVIKQRLEDFHAWVTIPAESLPADKREWLENECRLRALPHADEIEADIRDAIERAKHRPVCVRRGEMRSTDECDCGYNEERSGRMA